MRQSELFSNLNGFFRLFQGNPSAEAIKNKFFSCLEGIDHSKGLCDSLEELKTVYETTLRFFEREISSGEFAEDLLSLQRSLYRELENILSLTANDTRHHFLIVIPVADSPIKLKSCLQSLIEQCRIFQYGGFTVTAQGPVYNKISTFVIDDSKENDNIAKIKEICSETAAAGIRTYYIGLAEQTALIEQLPAGYREDLQGLLGESRNQVPPHKGASVSRNIAYLCMHAFSAEFREKSLIYFLDSDEEFSVTIKRGTGIADVPFINYFYWLDTIFDNQEVEILTGKVVGDPPVSPSVMVNTFLDDIVFFLLGISHTAPEEKCIFHKASPAEAFSAEYHDMVALFGYNAPLHPKEYACSLTGDHTVRDCFEYFSKKALNFFYGLHPTRTQFYHSGADHTETEKARTVYTGNYVMKTTGLRHFIPFASLKLRMAGPTLGRILRQRLQDRFVSAHLPLLHKRTSNTDGRNEFRTGIITDKNSIDLSLEFNRQFWGDIMLFSVEKLVQRGYPDNNVGLSVITDVVCDIQEKLWDLYRTRCTEITEKTGNIEDLLSLMELRGKKGSVAEHSVTNMKSFCSLVKNNFGADSVSMKKVAEQIEAGSYAKKIIDALHSFYETDTAWNELLRSPLASPRIYREACNTTHGR